MTIQVLTWLDKLGVNQGLSRHKSTIWGPGHYHFPILFVLNDRTQVVGFVKGEQSTISSFGTF